MLHGYTTLIQNAICARQKPWNENETRQEKAVCQSAKPRRLIFLRQGQPDKIYRTSSLSQVYEVVHGIQFS